MFKNILVPVDGSAPAHKATELAADLAGLYDSTVTVLCAWSRSCDMLQPQAETVVEGEAEALRQRGLTNFKTMVEFGDAARVILDCADASDVDLIVMGSRGRGQVADLLLGSVSHKVANEASCTCITVR